MALTIGICDDCQAQTELMERYMSPFKELFALDIISSNDSLEFLTMLSTHNADLVFLDIDMGPMDGIALGEQIRQLYEETVIVYITGHDTYALKAFQVRAFHYLLKPLTEEKFAAVFQEAVKHLHNLALQKPDKKLFKYQKKGVVAYLEYDQILYFEKIGRNVLARTLQESHEFPCLFSELLQELDQDAFMQCHQGFIIHMAMVRSYLDKSLILKGGFKVPISRSFAAEVRAMLEHKLFSRERDQ